MDDLSNIHFSQEKAIAALQELELKQTDVRKRTGDSRERISRLFKKETKFSADDALRVSLITNKDIREFAEPETSLVK